MMKRSLYHILYIAVLAWALTACSESEDLATTPTNGKVVKINISPYPAFTEDAGTRSVGTFDAGKTAWEAGDEILLFVGYENTIDKNIQQITLTYNGVEWKADKNINWLTTYTMVSALYAPDWKFGTEGSQYPILKEDAQYGTSEYLEVYVHEIPDDDVLSIDFSNATRNYSRLRIAGEASTTVNVAITDFTPAGGGTGEENYSLKTDENGNAYLYGSWTAGATLTIKGTFDETEMTLFNKTLQDASKANKGYVADARLNYKNEGDGTAENPYKISLPEQLAALATDVNNGTFTETEKYFALQGNLDLSDYLDWTPIGSTAHPFTGVFDGQGHTIRNLTIANSNPNDVKEWGLFGMVQDATIKNVRMGGNITLSNFGDRDDGAEADFDGIGGIAGRCSGVANNFYGCHSNVTIEGTGNCCWVGVGGIVGFVKEGKTTFVACGSTGKVTMESQTTEQIKVGGLIGALRITDFFTVHACYCNGEIHSIYNGEERGTGALFSKVGYEVSGRLTDYILIDAFYWSQVNGKPDALVQGALGFPESGTTLIKSSEWQTAMTQMNECLSTNHPDFGYQYVENTGADAAAIPLVLQAKTTNNNE